mgnify:CR=1 FL=1
MKEQQRDPQVKLSKSKTRELVWDKTDGKCFYCGQQTNPWREFCIDHFVAVSKGGTTGLSNLVPACSKCNAQKGDKTIEEFRAFKIKNVQFTEEQLALLASAGVQPPAVPKHVFWFEKNNVARDGGGSDLAKAQ